MPSRLPTLCALSALLLGASAVPALQGSARANDFPIADKVVVEKGATQEHHSRHGVVGGVRRATAGGTEEPLHDFAAVRRAAVE